MKRKRSGDALILAVIAREQKRLGRLLHENLWQTLTRVSIQLEVMSRRLQAGKAVGLSELTELQGHLHEAIDDTRTISGDLRAIELEGSGLMERLGKLATSTSQRVPCDFVCEEPVVLSNPNTSLALFRFAVEAVDNSVRHAAAKKIIISLIRNPSGIVLTIRDDGHGFALAVENKATYGPAGIAIMDRCARAIRATWKLKSKIGSGTIVTCSLSPPSGEVLVIRD